MRKRSVATSSRKRASTAAFSVPCNTRCARSRISESWRARATSLSVVRWRVLVEPPAMAAAASSAARSWACSSVGGARMPSSQAWKKRSCFSLNGSGRVLFCHSLSLATAAAPPAATLLAVCLELNALRRDDEADAGADDDDEASKAAPGAVSRNELSVSAAALGAAFCWRARAAAEAAAVSARLRVRNSDRLREPAVVEGVMVVVVAVLVVGVTAAAAAGAVGAAAAVGPSGTLADLPAPADNAGADEAVDLAAPIAAVEAPEPERRSAEAVAVAVVAAVAVVVGTASFFL